MLDLTPDDYGVQAQVARAVCADSEEGMKVKALLVRTGSRETHVVVFQAVKDLGPEEGMPDYRSDGVNLARFLWRTLPASTFNAMEAELKKLNGGSSAPLFASDLELLALLTGDER